MGKRAPRLPSWPCGLLEATSSGLREHLAAVGALWPNATAAFGAVEGNVTTKPTHWREDSAGETELSPPP